MRRQGEKGKQRPVCAQMKAGWAVSKLPGLPGPQRARAGRDASSKGPDSRFSAVPYLK